MFIGEFPIMTEHEFPYGLRCEKCKRLILPGQPYDEVVEGMLGEDAQVILVCVYC